MTFCVCFVCFCMYMQLCIYFCWLYICENIESVLNALRYFLCFTYMYLVFCVIALQLRSVLDSKGGPIQALSVHNVTRFSSNDVLVADSQGTVTVFCNEQILHRKRISDSSINCLQVEQDACKSDGHISCSSSTCLRKCMFIEWAKSVRYFISHFPDGSKWLEAHLL